MLQDDIGNWMRKTLHYTGAKGVVVGFSGGIDSAVCVKLAVDYLGVDKVHVLWMPESIKQHLEIDDYVSPMINALDIIHHRTLWIDIEEIKNECWLLDADPDRVDWGNLMARLRMAYLYLYARPRNLLVMGTSNKSEIMTGYFAKWGDGAADFEPIGNLYKTEVRELAKELDIPQNIIDRAPTAGLWEGQTDEGEMGITYDELDEILAALDRRNSKAMWSRSYYNKVLGVIYAKYGTTKVDKVKAMVDNSAHKREKIPTYGI